MKVSFQWLFPLVVILCISISACDKPDQDASKDDGRLKIITTIPPLYSFTKNIAGDIAEVDNLLPAGTGPHEYSFKPDDVKKVADADILVINGLGLESWFNGLVGFANGDGLQVVESSSGVKVIENDPHVWMSLDNAMLQVENIADALIKTDPENAGAYRQNTDTYIQELRDLDREIRFDARMWGKKSYIAEHSGFQYIAETYKLNQAATVQSMHEASMSPGRIIEIIDSLKGSGAEAILADAGPISKMMRMISGELELKIYRIDTIETGELSAEWYVEQVKANHLIMKMAFDKYY